MNAVGPMDVNRIKALEELSFVKLESALLCVNCELIVSSSRGGKCPVCGSGALLGLARLLGGTLDFSFPECPEAESHSRPGSARSPFASPAPPELRAQP